MNKAVLVIDVQNDFTAEKGFYLQRHGGGQNIKQSLQNITVFLEEIKNTVPVVCVYSNYRIDQFGEGISMCIPRTYGHEISIGNDLYSISFSKDNHSAFGSNELVDYLKIENISQLFIAGFLPQYCVSATAKDAKRLGYNVYVLKDCIGTADNKVDVMENLFFELAQNGISIINSKEYFKPVSKNN